MTHAAATIGLTFDGTDIQDADLGIFLEILIGLSEVAEVRGVDVTVPGLDGQIFRNRKKHRRRIVLSGYVTGNGATDALRKADYRANIQVLQSLFDPTANPAVLEATLEDGSVWTISARTVSNGLEFGNFSLPSLIVPVTVTLDSVDPDWVTGS